MSSFKIEIVRQINDKLARDWQALWQKAENANPFNSYGWFLTCLKTYKLQDYRIYTAYQDGKLVFVFPARKQRKFGIPVLTSIGNSQLAKTPFLIKAYKPKLIQRLFERIVSKHNLYLVQVEGKACSIIRKIYPQVLISLISLNPYLELSPDPYRFISKKNFKRIRKKIRDNQSALKYLSIGGQECKNYLPAIFSLEQSSTKKQKSKDIFSKIENRIFYQNLVRYLSDLLQFDFIFLSSKPIVYSVDFVYRNTCLAMHTAYLGKYSSLGPGKILVYHMLNDFYSRGIKIFDFGMGATIINDSLCRK
jgi:CelD/BcsL family acetyltransferase involved in cellulose biosynthesis